MLRATAGRFLGTGAAAATLIGGLLVGAPAAGAATAVAFGAANFSGYASGTEVHLGALQVGTTRLADVEQGFSSASTSTSGLTSVIHNEAGAGGLVVQPAQPASVHAYGMGSGLEVGVGTSTVGTTDPNQVLLAGRAQSTAPPVSPAVVKSIPNPQLQLSPVLTAAAVVGEAASVYDANQCPIGQPISFGLGDAARVNALYAAGTPVVGLTGNSTSVAQSDSESFLSANGDGTFGLTTQARDTIAPVSINIPGVGALLVTVAGTSPNSPITLDAATTGGGNGASVTLHNFSTVVVSIHLTATNTTQTLANISLAQVLANGGTLTVNLGVANVVSLGTLTVDGKPHAIGGSPTSSATVVSGTKASGALDIVNLNLTPTVAGTPVLNALQLAIGHLEASANLAAPITCGIPVIKAANPTSLTAGNPFTYTIQVPDPAKLALIACSLDNVTITDTITDKPGSGNATFQILSTEIQGPVNGKLQALNNTPTISQTSPTSATVTWKGLSYPIAPPGTTPNPPITAIINLKVPSSSPAGTIQDVVNATGTAAGCNGGASGQTDIGGFNGTVLTGTFTLEQPSVTAAGSGQQPTATTAAKLPFTGAMGGPWQPIAGLAVLGAGGGALALVRRSRRRSG